MSAIVTLKKGEGRTIKAVYQHLFPSDNHQSRRNVGV